MTGCFFEHAGFGCLTVLAAGPHGLEMNAQSPRSGRKSLIIKLAVVGVFFCVGALLLLRGVDLKEVVNLVLGWIRSVGPVVFFACMAVLPAFGFPILLFSLSAGPVFVPQLGIGWVLVCVGLSLIVNLALTYWLARYAFRPLLEGIIKRLGYQLPQVSAQDYTSLTVLVRVTPGPPFFVQGYLLGLAEVPFRIYMLVSLVISGSYNLAIVLFGDSLVNGKGKVAFIAFSLIVALSVLVQWARRRIARKKMQPA